MAYFKYFNTINYDVRGKKNKPHINVVTNILQRIRLKLEFVKHQSFFAQHTIVDGEHQNILLIHIMVIQSYIGLFYMHNKQPIHFMIGQWTILT